MKKAPALRRNRSWLRILGIGALLVGLLFLFDGVFQLWYYNQHIARVNKQAISRETWNSSVRAQCGETILDQLITQKLVEREIAKAGITVSEDEINQAVKQEQSAYGKSPDDFWKDLQKRGIDESSYRYRTQLTLAIRKILRPALPTPTSQDIAAYVQLHQDDPLFKEKGLTQEQIQSRAQERLLDIALAKAQAEYPNQLRAESVVNNYYTSRPPYGLLGSVRLLLGL